MNLDDMTEVAFTRLTWREKLAVVHIELWHGLRRLLRLEHRYWLTLDGKPLAKFTVDGDHRALLDWFIESHRRATEYGVTIGREAVVEKHLQDEHAFCIGYPKPGPAGPA